jgi:hypothetical protein
MRHAARLDPERVAGWLHTVVKHEALAITARDGGSSASPSSTLTRWRRARRLRRRSRCWPPIAWRDRPRPCTGSSPRRCARCG